MGFRTLIFLVILLLAGVAISSAITSNLIIEGPSNATVKEGSKNHTFTCQTSTTNETVQWRYNGNPLNVTYRFNYRIDVNNSLIIQTVTRKINQANFTCAVIEGNKTIEESNPARLTVWFININKPLIEPPILYLGDTNAVVQITWQAYPLPNSTWFLNGTESEIILKHFTVVSQIVFIEDGSFYAGTNKLKTDVRNLLEVTGNSSEITDNSSAITRNSSAITGNLSEITGNYSFLLQNSYDSIKVSAGMLRVVDECNPKYWKCPSLSKCIPSSDHCNNIDDCGDLSDETTNCSLPLPPVLIEIGHSNYNSIVFKWNFFGMGNVSNITTLITLKSQDGKILEEYQMHNGSAENTQLGKVEDLQNGTTYVLSLGGKTLFGFSKKEYNYTVPRMVSPSAPKDLSVKVEETNPKISVLVSYARPDDDGGTSSLEGLIEICRIRKQNDCFTHKTYIGASKRDHIPYTNWEGNTKYRITLYLQSAVKQRGPSVSIFYTTPELAHGANKLASSAIAGIVVGCLAAFLICFVAVCTTIRRNVRSTKVPAFSNVNVVGNQNL